MISKKLIVLSFLFVLTANLFGQIEGGIIGGDNSYLNPQKYTIAGIRVAGVPYYEESAIVLISGLTVGKEIMVPGDDISSAIKKLWEQELFSNVQILQDGAPKPNGDIFLIIQLEGRPKLSRFKFTGDVTRSEDTKIREIINLYSGKTITEALASNTTNLVRGFYQEKGKQKHLPLKPVLF